ncbi:hypothetical protein JW813_05300 [Clostridium botulinum]|uniref:hypothetical protein n=1 Tax=Clostridium botulinum TaxID=1491 RepID=UPI002245D6B0|nr:hypothetical protein [Clostridium botulinum]UZP04425.1 hypothetical protein JW813_05300 [Clostridium botulinum]UZP07837.1 hypothetical protein JYA71_05575 [Clostridium botulinum]UZP11164.1 hypothetical protein JYA74_05295 [Clostridium botulinum]
MEIIKESNLIKVYNDGIELLTGESIDEIKDIINLMITTITDKWELELLNRILYNISIDNCSTQEVA